MTHTPMGGPLPDGIGDDVRLTITTRYGPVLDLSLIVAAVMSRVRGSELLPFVYRDPYDPEEPDVPRPLRRARILIVDDGPLPGQESDITPGPRAPKERRAVIRDDLGRIVSREGDTTS